MRYDTRRLTRIKADESRAAYYLAKKSCERTQKSCDIMLGVTAFVILACVTLAAFIL